MPPGPVWQGHLIWAGVGSQREQAFIYGVQGWELLGHGLGACWDPVNTEQSQLSWGEGKSEIRKDIYTEGPGGPHPTPTPAMDEVPGTNWASLTRPGADPMV